MIRGASVNIWIRAMKFPEWDLKQIMTVHDEVNFVVKEEYAEEAKEFIKFVMEDTCKNFVVPVKSDVKIGNSYEETK